MRVSGYGDGATGSGDSVTADPSGAPQVDATAASGGALTASSVMAQTAAWIPAIGTGVATILAATFAVRIIDSIFKGRR